MSKTKPHIEVHWRAIAAIPQQLPGDTVVKFVLATGEKVAISFDLDDRLVARTDDCSRGEQRGELTTEVMAMSNFWFWTTFWFSLLLISWLYGDDL